MDATIDGDDGEYLKIFVSDNEEVEHSITFELDTGDLVYHEQEGYPDDPAERTEEANSRVNQARRFARLHVYRERGLDVIPGPENPDRIVAVILALLALPEDRFEEEFADLQAQLRSHFDGSTVELPFEGVDPSAVIAYEKAVYVRPDPVAVQQGLREAFLEHLDGSGGTASEEEITAALSTLREAPDVEDAPSFTVEAVSRLHYRHNDGHGNEQVHRGADPLAREPDARIQLLPVDPDQFASFRLFVLGHLVCQLRDCFLGMGVEPPAALQSPGQGKFDLTLEQQVSDTYEPYFDTDATIESWQPG